MRRLLAARGYGIDKCSTGVPDMTVMNSASLKKREGGRRSGEGTERKRRSVPTGKWRGRAGKRKA